MDVIKNFTLPRIFYCTRDENTYQIQKGGQNEGNTQDNEIERLINENPYGFLDTLLISNREMKRLISETDGGDA